MTRIAITMGDPAGIGPEVLLKALADPAIAGLAGWVIVGDASVIRTTEEMTGLSPPAHGKAELRDLRLLQPGQVRPGRLSANCGHAASEYIRHATQLCLDGETQAMVTAPVNKEAINLSGQRFTGHTEYIAELCGAPDTRMLLASERLRVVHVSTHVSLRAACDLDPARITRTIGLGHEALQRLGVAQPRIAVCGLNPHAGEHGLFGDEDAERIAPAVATACAQGIDCSGPLPADTIFLKAVRRDYDLVVAMYHDQGHIPMKLLDFERTVNVSLGLPIIRTSVDHGTAFDIAGKNQADASNMKAALRMAARMSH